MRISSRFRLASAGLLLATIVTGLIFLPAGQIMVAFLEWVESIGVWGPVLLATCCAITGPLLIPESIPTLAGGYLFGLTVGTVAALAGSGIAASATFLVGRTLLREPIDALVANHPRFRAIDNAVGRQGLKVVLVIRLSPMLPFGLLSYLLSMTRVSYRDYLLGTLIGTLPGAFMYVYLGSVAKGLSALVVGDSDPTVRTVLLIVGMVMTIVATVVVSRIARRAVDEVITTDALPEIPATAEAGSS